MCQLNSFVLSGRTAYGSAGAAVGSHLSDVAPERIGPGELCFDSMLRFWARNSGCERESLKIPPSTLAPTPTPPLGSRAFPGIGHTAVRLCTSKPQVMDSQ